MAQIQCPNCGGFKVNEGKCVVVATENHQIPFDFSFVVVELILLAFSGWLVVTGLTEGFAVKSIIGGLFTLLFIAGAINTAKGRATKKVPSVWQYDYSCELCGYRWTWRTDQPYPRVNVNPALIQQGEQRLEEQRRNYEQMQAAWWAQQQRKK